MISDSAILGSKTLDNSNYYSMSSHLFRRQLDLSLLCFFEVSYYLFEKCSICLKYLGGFQYLSTTHIEGYVCSHKIYLHHHNVMLHNYVTGLRRDRWHVGT